MSKKLHGNGRWESSRMMLPEHRAQLLSSAGTTNTANNNTANPRVPTKEELELIRSYIILPMILSIADNNRQQLERSSYTFKPLYLKTTLIFIDMVNRDLSKVRRDMRQRNIKVIKDEQADLVMYFRLLYRGYEERFGMVREVLRAELSVRITRYMREVVQAFTGAGL